mmetsp:Transcript_2044/g.5387  ORF Transcript_2044/g.5387 Transcript_2044/m.5387 type:complete len:99 (-) Transcript_2044:181-477(-)
MISHACDEDETACPGTMTPAPPAEALMPLLPRFGEESKTAASVSDVTEEEEVRSGEERREVEDAKPAAEPSTPAALMALPLLLDAIDGSAPRRARAVE